ncbi:hypothetical protein HYG81_23520 (plasmid) [Natrinema zhouii]|uniref:hypothetical protein n=1 Tax=Natrinema zhouii TaxID=1710539 RepID=UPI001D00163D|nr:hypothetical protein [Natrinema zhouii]UHQ98540.1 hypothetical protein HYG81_23520 [Natrinema zhouii]
MLSTQTDSDPNTSNERLYRALTILRGSFLLSIVAIGVVMLLLGAIFDSISLTQQDGVIAGMLGVFGLSAIAFGGTFYVLLALISRW